MQEPDIAPFKKVENQLLYVVYGDDPAYHIETKLSILSILHHTQKVSFTIRIITDQAAEYEGWPVEVQAATPLLLDEWLADTKYHYRRKIAGLLSVLDYADKTVFIDTDTFFEGDANNLFQSFGQGTVLVDTIEGTWKRGKQDNLVVSYLAQHYPEFDDSLQIINSGILGFSKEDKPLLINAINFIDELWPVDQTFRELEQFAVALALYKQKNIVEQKIIYHYYSKKEFFHEMGKHFFEKHGNVYQRNFLEKVKEILIRPLRPTFLKRLFFRLKLRSYPKKMRSGLLKLLYAIDLQAMPREGYKDAQVIAYWTQAMRKDFSRYNPIAYTSFQQGQWPKEYQKLVNDMRQKSFLAFLKEKGHIKE